MATGLYKSKVEPFMAVKMLNIEKPVVLVII